MSEHTGLEAARAIFRSAPFVADLGLEPTRLEPGLCETELVLQPRHLQHTGVVHAGVLSTMADHSAGAAAHSLVPAGHHVLTAELKLSLLRAARGERLRCRAQVIKAGRQISFTEAEVYCVLGNDEQLVAKLSATMAVVSPK